jgi:hypothetical protein
MNTKSSVIKMQKGVGSKVELAKAIVNMTTCFSDIHLSNTELTVLAYFMVYGINPQSKALIVKSSVCKNLANVKTIMVKLKKLELIYKDDLNGKVYVTQSLAVDLTPTVALIFKIDNAT